MSKLAPILLSFIAFALMLLESQAAQAEDPAKAAAQAATEVRDAHDHGPAGNVSTASPPGHSEHDGHDHGTAAPSAAPARHEHDEEKPVHREESHMDHGHEGHGHGSAVSDLDRPVDEMWAAKCEHDILHYTCDECRYELGVVKLSDTIFKTGGKSGLVSTAAVSWQDFSQPLPLTGEVATHDQLSIRVTAPVQAVVIRMAADIGQHIEQGGLLCELDSSDAAEAQGDFLKKQAALAVASKAAEREATLFSKKISAEVEVQESAMRLREAEIEAATARSKLLRIGYAAQDIDRLTSKRAAPNGLLPVYASRPGVVLQRSASPGDRVEQGAQLLALSDLSQVWVWADIREPDLHLLAPGIKPACTVSLPSGKKYSGMLEAVTGIMNEQTRTVRARISVANTDGGLRPGLFVAVAVLLPGRERVLAVPKTALVSDAGRDFVFVHKQGEYWIRRPVERGDSFGKYVAIAGGLTEGQTVIADGAFLLKSDVLRSKMGAGCAD